MRRSEIASIDNLDRLDKLGRCIGRFYPSVPQRDLDLRTALGCMSHMEYHKNRDKHSPAEMLRTRCTQHLRMLRSLASDGAHKSFHTLIDRTGYPDKHYPNLHDTPRVLLTPLLLQLLNRRELLRRAQVLERHMMGADVAAGVFADDIRHPERCCPSPFQERTQSLVEDFSTTLFPSYASAGTLQQESHPLAIPSLTCRNSYIATSYGSCE